MSGVGLAAAIAAHSGPMWRGMVGREPSDMRYLTRCSCGAEMVWSAQSGDEDVTAHVTAVIEAHLREWLAGEAVREVARAHVFDALREANPLHYEDADEVCAIAALDAVAGLLGGES